MANHLVYLRKLAEEADEILILSPFLASDMRRLLSEFVGPLLRSFRLITTLNSKARDQVLTAEALMSIQNFFDGRNEVVNVSICLAKNLHGKVYVFSREQQPFASVITSANFTSNGLSKNHEWGVLISDQEELASIRESVESMPVRKVSPQQVTAMSIEAQKYAAEHPTSEVPGSLDLLALMESFRPTTAQLARVWLKPSGVTEDPVHSGDARYKDPEVQLRFTTRKPTGVLIGDLVVVTGVGARRLLGLFEVISPVRHDSAAGTEQDRWKARWPWYVLGKNLAPLYSANWWNYDLYTTGLLDEYVGTHPTESITAVGGRTLGALNHGSDKIRLAPGFAEFLIQRILESEGGLEIPAVRLPRDASP
ncbi:MAG TPA: phospholipase D family protein [Longimicrobium sp.]|nr:phospholipase D family protein [Longimicrobium sp.]